MKRYVRSLDFIITVLFLSIILIPQVSSDIGSDPEPPIIDLALDNTDIVLDMQEVQTSHFTGYNGNISITKPEELRNRELRVDLWAERSSERISVLVHDLYLDKENDEIHEEFWMDYSTNGEHGRHSGTETYSIMAKYWYDDDEPSDEMLLLSGSVEIIGACRVDWGSAIVNQGPAHFGEWYTVTLWVYNCGSDPMTATLEPINLPSNIKCELSTYSCYILSGDTEDVIVKLTQTSGEPGYHEVEILIEAETWANNDSVVAEVHFDSQFSMEHEIEKNIGRICFFSMLSLMFIAAVVVSVVWIAKRKRK